MNLKKYFTEDEIWSIMEQIITAGKSLEEREIYHQDIRSENIFISNSC